MLELRTWLEQQLAHVSGKSLIAGAIRYALNHWDGLTRVLDDGRIELETSEKIAARLKGYDQINLEWLEQRFNLV